MTAPKPTSSAGEATAYTPRPRSPEIDLYLDANEGAKTSSLMLDPERAARLARCYPDLTELIETLAARLGRTTDEVVVTAGADDAIDRVMRAYLEPGRTLAVATPTFGMIPSYARVQGADVLELPWEDEWPVAQLLERGGEDVAVIAMVSPNNPTGRVIDPASIETVARAFPQAAILLDLAYVEYADRNPAVDLPDLPNVIQIRTLSKAWGLAGLRVGYAAASPDVVERLRAVGSPYPVSGWSAAVAVDRLRGGAASVDAHVERVREERTTLFELLESLGSEPIRSQANFVFARFDNAGRVADGLRSLGVAVRAFDGPLDDALRIGCPGDGASFDRLCRALRTVLAPDAYLFDLDGVLADVSRSYREAIRQTAAEFGADVTAEDIGRVKRAGDANDDWIVTQRLLAERDIQVSLEEITRRFEALYQGGLWEREELLVSSEWLRDLAARRPLGIVTGRPRRDAERFLESSGIRDLFEVVVSRDDVTNLKPDPEGLRLALTRMKANTGWYLGDTVDDVRAAVAAGLLPFGVLAPGDGEREQNTLTRTGAVTVVTNAREVF
jgi:histidinol-phosphate aminotransferase